MKLIYENYGTRYIVENDRQDLNATELKTIFSRILVQAGFAPNVIEEEDADGEWQWVSKGEIVIKKEELSKNEA